jgi:hypothetical protein
LDKNTNPATTNQRDWKGLCEKIPNRRQVSRTRARESRAKNAENKFSLKAKVPTGKKPAKWPNKFKSG